MNTAQRSNVFRMIDKISETPFLDGYRSGQLKLVNSIDPEDKDLIESLRKHAPLLYIRSNLYDIDNFKERYEMTLKCVAVAKKSVCINSSSDISIFINSCNLWIRHVILRMPDRKNGYVDESVTITTNSIVSEPFPFSPYVLSAIYKETANPVLLQDAIIVKRLRDIFEYVVGSTKSTIPEVFSTMCFALYNKMFKTNPSYIEYSNYASKSIDMLVDVIRMYYAFNPHAAGQIVKVNREALCSFAVSDAHYDYLLKSLNNVAESDDVSDEYTVEVNKLKNYMKLSKKFDSSIRV